MAGERGALRAVGTQFFLNGAVVATFVPRLPEIRDQLDLTVGELGPMLAVTGLVGLVGSWAAGPITERFGSKAMMTWGGLGLVAALAVIGSADHVALLVLGLGALAFFDVLVDIGMNIQGSVLSERRRTPVMHRLHGLWSVGTVCGGLVAAQAAAADVPLQRHVVGAAVMFGIVIVVISPSLLADDRGSGSLPLDPLGLDPEGLDPLPMEPAGIGPVVLDPLPERALPPARLGLVAIGLAAAASITVETTSSDWAAFRIGDDLGAAEGTAALAFVAYTAGMATGRLAGDFVEARFGRRRQMWAALGVATFGMVSASTVGIVPVALAAFVLAGLGNAPMFPQLYDDAARSSDSPARALGALTAGSRLASFIAPAVVGVVAGTSVSVGAAMLVVTMPSCAIWALTLHRAAG